LDRVERVVRLDAETLWLIEGAGLGCEVLGVMLDIWWRLLEEREVGGRGCGCEEGAVVADRDG
jgi:hypothetical protein